MNISMILIGGGVLIGALAFLPKDGDKEAEEELVFEPAPFYPGLDPDIYDPDIYAPEVVPYYPEPVGNGMPMGDPERRLTTTGNLEVTVGVR